MEVGAGDIVHLNILADKVTKVSKDICCCSNVSYTPDPTAKAINTTSNIWIKTWIPQLDCKDDCQLSPVMVMPVLSNTQNLHSPPPRAITFFQGYPKLIKVNELSSGHLKYAKRRRAVPKRPNTEFYIWSLRLVPFS